MATLVRSVAGVDTLHDGTTVVSFDTSGGNFLVIKTGMGDFGSSNDPTLSSGTLTKFFENTVTQTSLEFYHLVDPLQGVTDVTLPLTDTNVFYVFELWSEVDTATPIDETVSVPASNTTTVFDLNFIDVKAGQCVSAMAHWGVSSASTTDVWTRPTGTTPLNDPATDSTGRIAADIDAAPSLGAQTYTYQIADSGNKRQAAGFTINTNSVTLTLPATTNPGQTYNAVISGNVTPTSATLSDGTATVTQTLGTATYDAGLDETTVPVTTVLGNLPFGTGYTLEITMDDASTVTGTIDLVSTNFAVDFVNPSTEQGTLFQDWDTVNDGTPATGWQGESTVYEFGPDAFPLDTNALGTFTYRVWRSHALGWTPWLNGELVDNTAGGGDPVMLKFRKPFARKPFGRKPTMRGL